VTPASFLKWRAAFLAEQAERKKKEDEERMKGRILTLFFTF
jgi:hypothetical protein